MKMSANYNMGTPYAKTITYEKFGKPGISALIRTGTCKDRNKR